MRLLTTVSILLFLFLAGCKEAPPSSHEQDSVHGYRYLVPEQTNDGWTTGSLSDVSIDSTRIIALVQKIQSRVYRNFHGVVIVRHGKLVFEEYFGGYNSAGQFFDFRRDTLHGTASCTKSFTSCLIGIALDKHHLKSVNQCMYEFFPDVPPPLLTERKKRITLKDMLTMRVGLYWDEWTYSYSDSRNSLVELNHSYDSYNYVFRLAEVAEPGTTFHYNSGLSICLGGVIKNITETDADDFAEMHLFGPLQISQYRWAKCRDGAVQTGGGLSLRPRDMAKLGQLYLGYGIWNGRRIVSEWWVKESTMNHTGSLPLPWSGDGYGYQWWIDDMAFRGSSTPTYSARGYGGQFIFVFPDIDVVIVLTGGHYTEGLAQCWRIIEDEILPAVKVG